MASKNSDRHAMLNAIQHGVTIADLRIQRKEQQCGLCNIGDWGDGLNRVGEKLALVVLSSCSCRKDFWLFLGSSRLLFLPLKKNILAGMNGQDPLLSKDLYLLEIFDSMEQDFGGILGGIHIPKQRIV
jgi:hypothetical protein